MELTDLADTPNALGGAGQVLVVSADGTETEWSTISGGNTATWAQVGDTSKIPDDKITRVSILQRDYDATLLDQIADASPNDNTAQWIISADVAVPGNSIATRQRGIPAAYLSTVPGGPALPPLAIGDDGNNYYLLKAGMIVRVFSSTNLKLVGAFPIAFESASISGNDITFTKSDGTTQTITIPSTGGGSSYVLPDASESVTGGVRLATSIDDEGALDVPTAAQVKKAIDDNAPALDLSDFEILPYNYIESGDLSGTALNQLTWT